MFKKSTSTSRICDNKSTPIGWSSGIWFGGQFVNPPKKSVPKVYSTKSLSRIESFESYDNNYNILDIILLINCILSNNCNNYYTT